MSRCTAVWLSVVLTAVSAGCVENAPVRVEPQVAPSYPRKIAFHPKDPSTLLVVEEQGVSLWNLENPDIPERRLTLRNSAADAAFLPDGRTIITTGQDGRVRWWRLDGSLRLESKEIHSGAQNALAVAPNGALVASAGGDGTVRLWNLDGSPRGQPLTEHRRSVNSVAFAPRGDVLASAGEDGTVRLWNLDGSPHRQPLTGHQGRVWSVAFAPRGDVLASAGEDGTVRLWNLDGSPHRQPLTGHQGRVWSVAFAPRGDVLASAGEDGTVRLWNLDGSPHRQPLIGHRGWVSSVAFAPRGDVLASAGEDGTVRLWNLDGSPHRQPLTGHQGRVWSVAFAPRGDVLASAGGFDGTVRLWNLDGSPRGQPLTGHRSWVRSVAFAPRGDVLASAGEDGTVRLWNLDGSPHRQPLTGHQGGVRSVAFAPRGDVLASAGEDGTVRLWNLDGSPHRQPLTGHQGGVHSVAFAPRGDVLASAGEDGTVRLWNLASNKEIARVFTNDMVQDTGFVRNSLWASSRPYFVNFFSRSLELQASLVLGGRDGSIAVTTKGWYSGEGRLLETVKLYQGESPLKAASAGRYAPEEVVAAVTGERNWLRETWAAVSRGVRNAWQWYTGLNAFLQATLGATAAYGLLVITMVTLWVVRSDSLAQWAMPSLTAPESPGWKGVAEAAALVRWLGTTQRALDRWLKRHDGELEARCFEGRKSVRDRQASHYLELERSGQVEEWKQALAQHKPLAGWATGPGGCGKTTLAIMLARHARAMAGAIPVRPVLIEEDWGKDLIEHVARLLNVDDRRPTAMMVKKLGRTGRLVLLLDGLSERRIENAVDQVKDLVSGEVFRHVVVTSRSLPPDGEWFQTLSLGPVPPDRFDDFLSKYGIGDDIRKRAVAEVGELSGGQPVRALFLKLAADQLLKGQDLPGSYDGLVRAFVVGSRPRGKDPLREGSFLRAAGIVAYRCVVDEETIGPRRVAENVLRAALGEKAAAEPFLADEGKELNSVAVLDQLIGCGLLQRSVEVIRTLIGFSEDPIAEYLAAMFLVEAEDRRILANLRRSEAWKDSGLAEAVERVEATHKPGQSMPTGSS